MHTSHNAFLAATGSKLGLATLAVCVGLGTEALFAQNLGSETFRPTAPSRTSGTSGGPTGGPTGGSTEFEDGDDMPEMIELAAVVRDFRERTDNEGHPDFEKKPAAGFGHYSGNIANHIGENGDPVFTGDGWKVLEQWTDAEGRPICYSLYDPARGDVAGSRGVSSPGGITRKATFDQWFDDVPGMNLSKNISLKLHRQDDGTYVFDDKDDDLYADRGGFFPVEDQLFGNPGGAPDRNFHFTLEMHTEFTYRADQSQIFRFLGDDDVWVFIDGRLVIDLGGVHVATEQTVDLSRLGLIDGEMYSLDFFFAERHRTQSNFRIQTNLTLQSIDLPSVTAAFD